MMSSKSFGALTLVLAMVGAFAIGGNLTVKSNETTLIEQNLDWESDSAKICHMNLIGYSSSKYGSEYHLLHIGGVGEPFKTLYTFSVDGRKKPTVLLGAPVKSLCMNVDGINYAQHEQVKYDFVESTMLAEKNRLWVASNDLITQMGMEQ